MRRTVALCAFLTFAAVGCPSGSTTDEPAADTTRESIAAVPSPAWYHSARAVDLTGDGRADGVRLWSCC